MGGQVNHPGPAGDYLGSFGAVSIKDCKDGSLTGSISNGFHSVLGKPRQHADRHGILFVQKSPKGAE